MPPQPRHFFGDTVAAHEYRTEVERRRDLQSKVASCVIDRFTEDLKYHWKDNEKSKKEKERGKENKDGGEIGEDRNDGND